MKPANRNDDQPLEASTSLGLPGLRDATTTPATTQAPHSRPASADIFALIERNRIESLKRKQRADSFLNKLTDAQLTKVLMWFEDEHDLGVVHHHVTSAAPEGLGLQVSLPTLRRLRAHIVATHSNSRATEILDTLVDMEAAGDLSQSERIQSAIYQLLHQKAFELIRTEPGATELRDLLATIEKLSALDLKRQKLALDREKMLRRAHQASNPLPPRKHEVKLTIIPSSPAPEKSSDHPPVRQPVDILAPVPDIVVSN